MSQGYLRSAEIIGGVIQYVNDVRPGGLHHMAVVRSEHPHAEIRRVVAEAALALDESVRVFTHVDLHPLLNPTPHFLEPTVFGARSRAVFPLATERARYEGEPIAVVTASSRWLAVEAARLVRVEADELQALTTTEQALATDAPALRAADGWEDNVFMAGAVSAGDVEAVLPTAEHVASETIRIQRYTSSPIETRGYVGHWDAAGRLTLHASAQNPHQLRRNIAVALGVPESQVRVISPAVGGSFGLKMHGHPEEVLVAVVSRLIGRPVKWIEDRSETLLIGGREQQHDVTVGFRADGTIVALRNRVRADVGMPGATLGWAMARLSATTIPSGYRIPNVDVEYQAVATNKPPWNAARGYGKESAILVMERVMDLVARTTGVDPAEVRRRNLLTAEELPYRMPGGFQIDSGDYHSVLNQALELSGYDEIRRRQSAAEPSTRRLGIGLGFEVTPEAGGIRGTFVQDYESVMVRVDPGGAVTVLTGITSPGGGNDSGIAMIVGEQLGVPWRSIRVVQGDTDLCPYGFGNYSGRSTLIGGGAALLAATEMRAHLLTAARDMLGRGVEELDLADGQVVDTAGAALLSLGALAEAVYSGAGGAQVMPPLEVTRTYRPGGVDQAQSHNYPSFSNGLYIALVEVDVETGVVDVREISAVHDCGRVIDEILVDGQIRGAVAMGLGGALMEEQRYSVDGRLQNNRFKSYLMPRVTDMPLIRIAHHETPSPNSLLGSKGAGEAGLGGTAAAVVNAVEDALREFDVRFTEFPVTPPRVLRLIKKSRGR